MQRDALPGPVVRRQRGRACDLVQVERVPSGQDGQVDRLAHLLGQRPAHRPALLHQVEPAADRPGQPDQAHSEPVPPARRVLGHQLTPVQRGQQPGRGGLVHAQLARDLGHPGLPLPGQDLQDGHRSVHRLHRPGVLPPRPSVSPSRPSVSPSRPSPLGAGGPRGPPVLRLATLVAHSATVSGPPVSVDRYGCHDTPNCPRSCGPFHLVDRSREREAILLRITI